MRYDPALGGVVPAVSGTELLEMVPGLEKVARITLCDYSNKPSCHLSPENMLEVGLMARDLLSDPGVDGVVVTHGTDALEETAYMVDLLVDSHKPAVFTAAMRNNSEVGTDGPRNILGAVRVAASPRAQGLGTVVAFNGRILAARDTIKMHTSNLDAFRSPMLGPLGSIDDDAVAIYRTSLVRQHIPASSIEPRVLMVRVYAGMDSSILEWSLQRGDQGLVIEAMGEGNVPPHMVPGIQAWIDARRPVVLVSRSLEGRAADTYAYPGGGKQLRRMGVIFGEDLTGIKTRIKLMLALAVTRDLEQIRGYFEYLG